MLLSHNRQFAVHAASDKRKKIQLHQVPGEAVRLLFVEV